MLDLGMLAERTEAYRAKNEFLALENEMFSRYLKRKAQGVPLGQAGSAFGVHLGGGNSVVTFDETQSDMMSEASSTSTSHAPSASSGHKGAAAAAAHRGRRSRARERERYLLPLEAKVEISKEETEQWMMEANRDMKRLEEEIEDIQARMVESDIHVADLRKEALDFRREILLQSDLDSSQMHTAEKVLKFFDESIKKKDALCEKLKLKNMTMKVTRRKLEQQLKQREEGGESFDEVDFQQLQIEHAQFLEKIDEKNQELLQLKLTTANTVAALNAHKEDMSMLVTDNAWLHREIESKERLLERLREEYDHVEHSKGVCFVQNERLKQQQEEVKVPEILDYVEQKAAAFELEKELDNWKRKAEIAEGTLKTLKSKYRAALARLSK